MSGLILWLEPTHKGVLPESSLFLSSDRFVVSTYVLGTLDPLRRRTAYERIVKALVKRIEAIPLEELFVKHTNLSLAISCTALQGSVHPPSPFSYPGDLVSLTSFNEILKDQELIYGVLPKEDKLKLIAQAVYGGEHMLKDAGAAWNFFLVEWNAVESTRDEPLAERISPEGDIYRINLRPAKELGIKPEAIFEAALRSAVEISRDLPRRIERVLPQALSIGIEPSAVPSTPSRHSVSYKEKAKPSYRLIRPRELDVLLGNLI